MSLHKRGKTWHIDFRAPNGQRIRRSTGTSDKRRAQELLDHLKVEMWRVHKLGEKPRRTWKEATVRWIREKQYKTDLGRDKGILRWLDPFFGDKYLDEISRDLIDEVAAIKHEDVAPATVNRYLALIRSILKKARDDWEWIDKAPRVQLFPEPQQRVRFLTREEATRLKAELPSHLADMAAFSLATGLRAKNVRLLEWDHVDLEARKAWVDAWASKSRKALTVPLNEDALRVLLTRRSRHPRYVFTFRGKPVTCVSTKAWKAALKRAGIEDFRWHDLRHTWASWHVQAGTSLAELKELGGWSCYEMVLRYAHLGGEHLKTAADRILDTKWSQKEQGKILKLVVSN